MHKLQEKLLKTIGQKDLSGLSLREIGVLEGERSAQKIRHHLMQLSKKGFITYNSQKRIIRRIPIKTKEGFFVSLPIVGSANCGPANIFAEERIEGYLKVSKKMVPANGNLFVLRAEGNSMNRAKVGYEKRSIEDGDFIIVDKNQSSPESGNYVVSVIDEVANIKKFVKDEENKRVILQSESTQEYLPIFIHKDDQYRVSGRVLGVIKKLKT